MPVSFSDLLLAFDFVSDGSPGSHEAYVCKQSGKIYWHFEDFDDVDQELPDDIEDPEKYVQIPDRRELDLGKPLVFDFTSRFLPGEIDKVELIFSRKGAYANFRALLAERGALDRWHEFSDNAEKKALREWCKENSIEVSD